MEHKAWLAIKRDGFLLTKSGLSRMKPSTRKGFASQRIDSPVHLYGREL